MLAFMIAMGSPISPLKATLFMEECEVKSLSSCPPPPTLWLRCWDDTFVIIKAEHSKVLLQHINNQDPHIQFTVEEPSQQGTLPFLDTLEPNNTFTTSVYRKPTHRDQYLHWDSNHFIIAKQCVYNTLAHRAKIVSSNQEAFDQELLHIRKAIQACQFPNWALNQLQHKFHRNNQPSQDNNHNSNSTNNNNTNSNNRNIIHCGPLHTWYRTKVQKCLQVQRYTSTFQGYQYSQNITSHTQGQGSQASPQVGLIYHFKCPHINCPEAYIGESGRALGERIKDYLKPPSTYSPSQQFHRTSTKPRMFQCHTTGKHKVLPGTSRKPCCYGCQWAHHLTEI